MAALPTFISTAEAAHQLGIGEARLRCMIENGTIKAANISGEIVVSEASVRGLIPKEQLPEFIKHAQLKNMPIWIRNAARKYDIPNPTIVRWVAKAL